MKTRKFMARTIIVERGDTTQEYPLSIATVAYAADGSIAAVDVEPYIREIPGVEYVDTPLRLKVN